MAKHKCYQTQMSPPGLLTACSSSTGCPSKCILDPWFAIKDLQCCFVFFRFLFFTSSEVYKKLGCSPIWSANHGMCLPRCCQQFQADFAELPVLWWTRTFKSTIPFYNMKALVKDRATGNVCFSHFTWHIKCMKIYFFMSCYSLYYSWNEWSIRSFAVFINLRSPPLKR